MPDQDLLNEAIIRSAMDPSEAARLLGLEVYLTLDSTNQHLLAAIRQGSQGPRACLAEYQTAGRGRHGKVWLSPFASGLCLSLLWTFEGKPTYLPGLSLAVGVASAEVLEECGVSGIRLKWPNDLYWSGRKLAGLLIDVVARTEGPIHCVIGLGINIQVHVATLEAVDQPWTDLATTGWRPLSRNHLAAALLSGLLRAMRRFEAQGIEPFLDSWQKREMLTGRVLKIQLPGGQLIEGIGAGIDFNGALRVETNQGVLCFTSGEITIRSQPSLDPC
ncbi:Bifunctional ligase/repressor BirA [Gammaproteobacteria bacterium]